METTKIVSPYLRVFEDPIEDNSITRFEYLEYLPRDSNNMDRDDRHIIETVDKNVWLLPHKGLIKVLEK